MKVFTNIFKIIYYSKKNFDINDLANSVVEKRIFERSIQHFREYLENTITSAEQMGICAPKNEVERLEKLMGNLDVFEANLNIKFESFQEHIQNYLEEESETEFEVYFDTNDEGQQGLDPQIIQQFEQFQADESIVSDQCVICKEDIEIGRNMMRLDCDGQHTFCQACIEEWFANKNTCPICRHSF